MRLLKHSIRFWGFFFTLLSYSCIIPLYCKCYDFLSPMLLVLGFRNTVDIFVLIDAFYGVDFDVITLTLLFLEDVTIRLSINSAPGLKLENYDKDG